MTGCKIEVHNAPPALIKPFAQMLEEVGIQLKVKDNTINISKINLPLKPTTITTGWEPGFLTDWQPLATLMLTHLAKGKSTIHEKIFETRWRFLEELSKAGVRYELFQPDNKPKDYNFNDSEYRIEDPHAAHVYGPTELKPAELRSHDVRAGIDMLIVALAANGKSVIYDPQNHIDRGYENIVEKLTMIGADIKRV